MTQSVKTHAVKALSLAAVACCLVVAYVSFGTSSLLPEDVQQDNASAGSPLPLTMEAMEIAEVFERQNEIENRRLFEVSSPSSDAANSTSTASLRAMGARHLQTGDTFVQCLRNTGIPKIVLPSDGEYNAAKHCLIWEPNTKNWNPSAIVKPATAEQVGAAVKCAVKFGMTVSPRSGSHGFMADGCRGQLIVDMSLHNMVEQAKNDRTVVIFGAGQLHGNLYSRLEKVGLSVPGGTESMVGVGGLWLGCGRGMTTQIHGVSCDQIYAVQYVDAKGNVEWADNGWNADMLWMARGSGGLFPGILTKIVAQAHPVPKSVAEEVCYYPLDHVKLAMEVYVKYLDYYNDPASRVFSGLHFNRFHASIDWNCWECNAAQMAKFTQVKEATKGEIRDRSGYDGRIYCNPYAVFNNMEQKLLSRGWDTFQKPEDLITRPDWPMWKDIDGLDLSGSAYNGAILVPNNYVIGDALLTEIANYAKSCPGDPNQRHFLDYGAMYPMKGRNAQNVDPLSTPYIGRDSKVVIHFKKDKVDGDRTMQKAHLDTFERALTTKHGLPCKSFYNYSDGDLTCATTVDQWLAAYFTDPNRIKSTVQRRDPNRVFYRSKL